MIRKKNLLAENMQRFGTKNLQEKRLTEAYRNADENVAILMKILKKRQFDQAIEFLENVQDNLRFGDNLEDSFDDAAETFNDSYGSNNNGRGRQMNNPGTQYSDDSDIY
jgi:hypothetical protein